MAAKGKTFSWRSRGVLGPAGYERVKWCRCRSAIRIGEERVVSIYWMQGLLGLDGHLFAELDDAQPRAAVDGGILEEPSALD